MKKLLSSLALTLGFSAVPELLEALNDLLDDVGRASSMIGARKARAAIAKATGVNHD